MYSNKININSCVFEAADSKPEACASLGNLTLVSQNVVWIIRRRN